MRTIKPFSTISFNTKEYLINRLNDLVNEGVISLYAFMHHDAEDDEKKEHFHVYIVPVGMFNTDRLHDVLIEPVPDNDKPLGCIDIKSSKFVDWYLYALHDKDYLAMKGQTRKYHYLEEEFVVSDWDTFLEYKHTCDFSKYKTRARIREMVYSGVPFYSLVADGFIPVNQIFQYREYYNTLKVVADVTDRGASVSHKEI